MLVVSLALVLLVAQSAPAPKPDADLSLVAAELRDGLELPGLGLAVARGGRVVATAQAGWADEEKKVAFAEGTRVRIGSCSKLLTASAVLRLAEKGTIDLDAPISRYLADLPPDKAAITARQLAGHLSGIRHYGKDDFFNTTAFANVADSSTKFLGDPLRAMPGAQYAYSSYGYNLLGAVVQSAAKKEFRQVVADEVLAPLGLTATVAEDSVSASSAPDRARAYSRGDGGALVDAARTDLTDRWPSGGYLSTASDLVRLGAGVSKPGFLDATRRELVLTPQKTADGTPTKVGIGWRIATDGAGRRYLHHGGESLGGRAFVLVYPDADVVVALVTNLSLAPIGEKEALRLAEPFLR